MFKHKNFLYLIIFIIYISFIFFQIKKYKDQKEHEIYHAITISSILDKYLQSAFYSMITIEDLYLEQYITIVENFDLKDKSKHNYFNSNEVLIINNHDFINFLYSIDNQYTNQDIDEINKNLQTEDYLILDTFHEDERISWFIAKHDDIKLIFKINNKDLNTILTPLFFKEIFIDLDNILKRTFKNEDSLIKFVAIQDYEGIIAATESVSNLEKIESSAFLISAFKSQKLKYQFLKNDNSLFLEIINPITHNNETIALLRLCMDVSSIKVLYYQTIFFITIYTLVFLFLFYSLYTISNNDKYMFSLKQKISQSNHLIEIGHLGAELAHEIKNPLNTISMALQRISFSKEISKSNHELLSMSTQELLRLNDTINKFLNYSTIDTLTFKKNDFKTLTNAIINLFSIKAQNEEIKILDLTNKSLIFNFDYNALKQVMINIILNSFEAFSHVDKQDKRITVKYEKVKDDYTVTISDNATGIDSENINKIFDLFFTNKDKGSGIGLASVKKIIKAHNGEVLCFSKLNEGTKIKITIPE